MSVSMAVQLLLVGVATGGIYALIALGLNTVYGVARVFNFAQGSFILWAGYICWVFHQMFHLDYGLAFIITMVVMYGFGVAYEKVFIYPLRRFPQWGWTAIIVTLGSALLLDSLIMLIFGPKGRALPLVVEGVFTSGDISILRHDVVTLAIVISAVAILAIFLKKSRPGLAMRAVSQDTIGAEIVGLPINKVYNNVFGIAAMLAGIGGMLLAPRTQLFPWGGWPVFNKALVVMVFGGLGSTKGTLIAAFALAILEAFTTYHIGGQLSMALFLLILVILLVFRPKGLFGVW